MSLSSATIERTRSSSRKVGHNCCCSVAGFYSRLICLALPSKPLNLIALSDANSSSALQFVQQKLHDGGVDVKFTREQTAYLERLGGRASDLESVSLSKLTRPGYVLTLCPRSFTKCAAE